MKKLGFLLFAFGLLQCASNRQDLKQAKQLVLEEGEIFKLQGNAFSIDSLIMHDGSVLVLDARFANTIIRTNYFSFGTDCLISGRGRWGERGADGIVDNPAMYRFRNTGYVSGLNTPGRPGQSGGAGINLNLYCAAVESRGSLIISLQGGNGGMGGSVGNRQASLLYYPLTRQSGFAPGGFGGGGGNISLSYPRRQQAELDKVIIISNEGGFAGNVGSFNAGKRIQANKGKVDVILLRD
jgi:hypothetical protein